MSDTYQQFREAVDSDPTDWDLRRIFADWLEDQGDARYESQRFIAAWCLVAGGPMFYADRPAGRFAWVPATRMDMSESTKGLHQVLREGTAVLPLPVMAYADPQWFFKSDFSLRRVDLLYEFESREAAEDFVHVGYSRCKQFFFGAPRSGRTSRLMEHAVRGTSDSCTIAVRDHQFAGWMMEEFARRYDVSWNRHTMIGGWFGIEKKIRLVVKGDIARVSYAEEAEDLDVRVDLIDHFCFGV